MGKARKSRKRARSDGDLQLVTWNIQKVNKRKCTDQGAKIVAHLDGCIDPDAPYVVGILENRTAPEEVEGLLRGVEDRQARKRKTRTRRRTGSISMGGAPSVRENLVYSAGGGAVVEETEEWKDWQPIFTDKTKASDTSQRSRLINANENYRRDHAARESTRTQTSELLQGIQHPAASHFRNPVLLTIKVPGKPGPYKLLVVHAPGPQGREVGQSPYAETFMKSVFEAAFAKGIHVIQGDMNVYSDLTEYSGYEDRTLHLGTTTQNTTGGISRLDRAYVFPGVDVAAEVNRIGIDVLTSDHFSLKSDIAAGNPSVDDLSASSDSASMVSSDSSA